MTYIPNCRNEYVETLCKNTKGASKEPKKNLYWEGNLNVNDKEFIAGYDTAVRCVEDFFDNAMPTYAKDEEYKFIEDILEVEFETDEEKRLAKELFKEAKKSLLDWLESQRNGIVIAMIDEYPYDKD